MKRFEGKVALGTGAGSGISLATARRLATEGAAVVAAIYEESQREAVADFDAVRLDATSEADWQAAAAHLSDTHGGLDVLVNNAGIFEAGTVEETSDADWRRVIDTNLGSVFRGTRMAVPLMRQRGGGAIVNTASINSIRGNNRTVAYSASKGGVMALTMAAALDHVADKIRVNCVCPGSIATDMIESLIQSADDASAMRAAVEAKHPIGRLATAEEVASVIAFLASEDASFMTGLAIPVDGARSIR